MAGEIMTKTPIPVWGAKIKDHTPRILKLGDPDRYVVCYKILSVHCPVNYAFFALKIRLNTFKNKIFSS